jgi:hypothetical protein
MQAEAAANINIFMLCFGLCPSRKATSGSTSKPELFLSRGCHIVAYFQADAVKLGIGQPKKSRKIFIFLILAAGLEGRPDR